MDVISTYLLAFPTTKLDASTSARVKHSIITKHANLPMTTSSDKAPTFVPQMIKEVADVLGISESHSSMLQQSTDKQFECSGEHTRHWEKQ